MEATATVEPSFGQRHFGGVDLGHKKRNECLIRLADVVQRRPGGTLPDKLASPKDYKAMCRLVNREEVTHFRILKPHYAQTRQRMAEVDGYVLVVHDTTTLDYSGLHSVADLGPIGEGHGRGYLCHNSLAVDPQRREVLGLVHQILHRREPTPAGEGVAAKRERTSRESRLWSNAVEAIGRAPTGARVVDVADRGADLFEFLATEEVLHRLYLVRAKADRNILVGHGADAATDSLFGYARALPTLGRRTVAVADRDGEPGRKATLTVAAAPIQVLPPQVRKGLYDEYPLLVWVVVAREENPPDGVEALEWILLTKVPTVTAEEAWTRVAWYGCRWMVEEYHKGQKTGCGIEDLQFTTGAALQAMIAILSVVAVSLLNLREASRQPDATTRSATEVIDPEYVEVLAGWRYQDTTRSLTVHDFYYALARLGGHQNRKRDKRPGWLVLWRGWMKLQNMVDGARAVGYQRLRKRANHQSSSGGDVRGQT